MPPYPTEPVVVPAFFTGAADRRQRRLSQMAVRRTVTSESLNGDRRRTRVFRPAAVITADARHPGQGGYVRPFAIAVGRRRAQIGWPSPDSLVR